MEEARLWLSLLAAIGLLSLAITAATIDSRARAADGPNVGSPVARPLGALCFALFGFNFAVAAKRSGVGTEAFNVLDSFFTAVAVPLVLEVVLAFVGRRRSWFARAAAWAWLGGLGAASLLGLQLSNVAHWLDSPSWHLTFLVGLVPTVGYAVALLLRHLMTAEDAAEQARTRTIFGALMLGTTFSLSDIARTALGAPMPSLAALGTLLAAVLLFVSVLRFELFDRNVSVSAAVYAGLMTTAFVTAYLLVFRTFRGSLPVQVFAGFALTLLVGATAREVVLARREVQARAERLTVLGRFSAQLAHDVRSPLSALLGAAQVLELSRDEAEREELLGLLVGQARRIAAIIERYDRMARIELRTTLVRPNELVREVARAAGIRAVALDAEELALELDRDLFASALENVVRNAVEACSGPDAVRVRTLTDAETFTIEVSDDGPGMDARQLARAFEDFYTTKPHGSGLGLPFARRVLVAHGGDVRIESRRGGTTVRLNVPLTRAAALPQTPAPAASPRAR